MRRLSRHELLPRASGLPGQRGVTCSCGRWSLVVPKEDWRAHAERKHREHVAAATKTVLVDETPDPANYADALTQLLALRGE